MTGVSAKISQAVRDLMLARFGLMPETFSDAELEQRLRPEFGPDAAIEAAVLGAAGEPLAGENLQRLVAALTIRESSFLRQRSWFEALMRDFVGPIVARKRAAGTRDLCLWSAGCSSGDEGYSLALMTRELLGADAAAWRITVHGTDICSLALAQARSGRYRPWSLRELTPERRAAHFVLERGEAQVSDALRGMVEFRLGNLLDGTDEAPEAPDVILCRNVLMHLEPAARARVAGQLVARLAPGGILATAPSEASLELFRPLIRHDRGELLVFQAAPAGPAVARPKPAPQPPHRIPGPRPPVPAAAPALIPALPRFDAVGAGVRDLDPAALEVEVDRLVAAKCFAEAGQACERAIDAAPLDPAPLRLLAAVQEAGQDLSEACGTLRRLLYLDERDCDARFRLAGLLRRLGREAAARRELRGIVDLAARAGAGSADEADPDPMRARILRAARQMLGEAAMRDAP